MTFDELKTVAAKAIAAGFPLRNTRVFTGPRQARLNREQRTQLREWVVTLRYARSDRYAPAIRLALQEQREAGHSVMMAHTLRRLVIDTAEWVDIQDRLH